jgi:hypothetical protein
VLFYRWNGDYGDQKQKLFPANYCEEINYITEESHEEEEESEVELLIHFIDFTRVLLYIKNVYSFVFFNNREKRLC